MLPHILRVALVLCGIGANNAHDMRIFQDFLQNEHLKYGIVVSRSNWKPANKLQLAAMHELWSQAHLRVYNKAQSGTDFRQLFHYRSRRVGVFVADFRDTWTQHMVLDKAADAYCFNNSQAWLLMMDRAVQDCAGRELEIMTNALKHLRINIDADITVAIKSEIEIYRLYDVYKIYHKAETPLRIEPKGFWSRKRGYVLYTAFRESFIRRRRNFQGLQISTVSAMTERPKHLTAMEHLGNTVEHTELDYIPRKVYSLINMMQPMFNFSFLVTFVPNYGEFVNGSWVGTMKYLVDGDAEFSISPLRISKQRLSAIDYAPEVHAEVLKFLFRHPKRIVLRNIFLEPFDKLVWWCLFSLIIGAILLLWLLIWQEYKFEQQPQEQQSLIHCNTTSNPRLPQPSKRPKPQHEPYSAATAVHLTSSHLELRLDYYMLIILSAIFMQGPSPNTFNAISTRTLLITICVFSLMLLQFYGAFIVGSLLSVTPRSITTPSALLNSTLVLGMQDISYNNDEFQKTNNPIARAIYEQRICKNPVRNIMDMEHGVERIKRGGFAFQAGLEQMYRRLNVLLTEKEFCELQTIEVFQPLICYAPCRKGSPFREHLRHSVLHFQATSLAQYNTKMWTVKNTDCALVKSNEIVVDWKHCIPALTVLASGMLIAWIVLLLEVSFNWWKMRCAKMIQLRTMVSGNNNTKNKGQSKFKNINTNN